MGIYAIFKDHNDVMYLGTDGGVFYNVDDELIHIVDAMFFYAYPNFSIFKKFLFPYRDNIFNAIHYFLKSGGDQIESKTAPIGRG